MITLRFLTHYFRHRNLIPFGLYCVGFGAFMTVFTAVAGATQTDGLRPRGGAP